MNTCSDSGTNENKFTCLFFYAYSGAGGFLIIFVASENGAASFWAMHLGQYIILHSRSINFLILEQAMDFNISLPTYR